MSTTPQNDLSPELVSLARQIARDCKRPGRYQITLNVPEHKNGRKTAVITREEKIREIELNRHSPD